MKKKVLSTLLALAMAGSLLAGCGSGSSAAAEAATESSGGSAAESETKDEAQATENGDMPNIVVVYAWNELPANLDEIQQKINDITAQEIGCTVTLQGFTYGNLQQQMSLTLSSPSEQWDCLAGMYRSGLGSAVSQGQLMDMTDLIEEYGSGVKEALGETRMKMDIVNGKIYGVTTIRNNASQQCIVFDKKYIDDTGIDLSGVATYADLTDVFAKLHEAYPDKYVTASSGTKPNLIISSFAGSDNLSDSLGILADASVPTVSNMFETEAYKELCHLTRSWNEAGYVYPDILTDEGNSGQTLMKNDMCLSYFTSYTPDNGAEYNAVSASGETIAVPLESPILMTNQNWSWTIPTNSVYPEKAMQFINLCYTNEEIVKLLCYGVEGSDWEIDENGYAVSLSDVYPDKKTWLVGNGTLAPVQLGGNADHWEQIEDFNNAALVSSALGFVFDATDYAAEETALSSVLAEYRNTLEWGFASDVDQTLADFNEALYDAGLQTVMDAKQTQLNTFLGK